MKHIHAELIKAWADGAKIEARYLKASGWTEWRLEEGGFIWYKSGAEYRIKPEPKPDVVNYLEIGDNKQNSIYVPRIEYACNFNEANLKIIWDGETGKIKNAEVIK